MQLDLYLFCLTVEARASLLQNEAMRRKRSGAGSVQRQVLCCCFPPIHYIEIKSGFDVKVVL
jgi:hypothetical protein